VRLFVDTSAWYALYDRRDDAHLRAATLWKELQRRPTRLITSDYVFSETVTLTRIRAGHGAACRLGGQLLTSQVVDVVAVSAHVREEAWRRFVKHDDQDFSFVDCTSFVIMQELGLSDVFAFDDHFRQMGFRLHPS
jgi:hypothetical protein